MTTLNIILLWLILFLGIVYYRTKCSHKYTIIQEEYTTSKLQHTMEQTGECHKPRDSYQFDQMTARKHITILQCEHCGKIKRFVEKI